MGALSEVGLRFNSPEARSMFNMPDPKPRTRPMMKPQGDDPTKLSSIQPRKPPARTPAMNSADKRKACPSPLASEAFRLAAFADSSRPDEISPNRESRRFSLVDRSASTPGFGVFSSSPDRCGSTMVRPSRLGTTGKTGPVSRAHHICGAIPCQGSRQFCEAIEKFEENGFEGILCPLCCAPVTHQPASRSCSARSRSTLTSCETPRSAMVTP